MVGAGVFGFLINPPIVLYYAQGINTTPIHSHGALFGVYGFLAIALMLFSVRNIVRTAAWSDRLLKIAFWGLNVGLATMILVLACSRPASTSSSRPSGTASGTRASPAVTGSAFIHTVTWLRVVPDLVFDAGAIALVAFLVRAIAVDLKLRKAQPAAEAADAKGTVRKAA